MTRLDRYDTPPGTQIRRRLEPSTEPTVIGDFDDDILLSKFTQY
jgi:hypothetical protein